MYKLAIVEDEDFIRNHLAKIIEQNIPHFEVAGLYSDASLIVDTLDEYDVILSDIRMTKMSGLELAEKVYTEQAKPKIVLISAYTDFEYAKKALKYDVFDYLEKPIKVGELKKVFENLKDILDKKRASALTERRNLYTNLAIGNIMNIDLEALAKKLEPSLDVYADPICIYEIVIDNYDEFMSTKWHYEKDVLLNALYSFFDFDNGFLLRLMLQTEERIIVLASDKRTHLSENGLLTRMNEADSILGIKMSIFDKTPLDNLAALLDNNSPINNTITIKKEQGQLLFSLINEKNVEAAISIAEKIKHREKIFSEITKRLQETYPYVAEISPNLPCNLWINEIISAIDKTANTSDTIEQIKAYLYDNFQNDISLDEIAQEFYFNKAYLGRLFKEKTGESFNYFLIKIRMQKAKELLKNPQYKIYEISAAVGYKSAKYFNKVFSAYYGISPTEYRKRRMQQ